MVRTLLIAISIVMIFSVNAASLLPELDQVIHEAGDITNFLDGSDAFGVPFVDRYYAKASLYFSGILPTEADLPESKTRAAEVFPRAAYDAIIDQIRESIAKDPRLAKELFSSIGADGPRFSVQGSLSSYGRRHNEIQLNLEINRWIDNLGKTIDAQEGISAKQAVEIINQLKTKFDDDLKSATTNAQRAKIQGDFYKGLYANPMLQSFAANLLQNYYKSMPFKNIINSGNADGIIQLFETLSKDPATLIDLPPEISSELNSILKNLVPRFNQIIDSSLFPKIVDATGKWIGRSRESTVSTFPVSNRFHTLFKGIKHRECIGGSCEFTPSVRRWITGAIPDSQYFILEENGRYNGFVQMIEMVHDSRPGRYYSVDFGSPLFGNGGFVKGSDGKAIYQSFFESWRAAYTAIDPNSALLFSDQEAISNYGQVQTIKSSSRYFIGDNVGIEQDFIHKSKSFVERVGQLPDRNDSWYGKTVVHEASTGDPLARLRDVSGNELAQPNIYPRRFSEVLKALRNLSPDEFSTIDPDLLAGVIDASNSGRTSEYKEFLEILSAPHLQPLLPSLSELDFARDLPESLKSKWVEMILNQNDPSIRNKMAFEFWYDSGMKGPFTNEMKEKLYELSYQHLLSSSSDSIYNIRDKMERFLDNDPNLERSNQMFFELILKNHPIDIQTELYDLAVDYGLNSPELNRKIVADTFSSDVELRSSAESALQELIHSDRDLALAILENYKTDVENPKWAVSLATLEELTEDTELKKRLEKMRQVQNKTSKDISNQIKKLRPFVTAGQSSCATNYSARINQYLKSELGL